MLEPPRTHVHDERTVYDGSPWLHVKRHNITTPDGMTRSHHSVQLNTVATVMLLDDHERVLMVRRHRWIIDQVGWESPGGIVDPGEDPEACARRELLEETGFEAETFILVAELEPMPGLVQSKHYVFIADHPRQVNTPTDAEEAGRLVWVPVYEAVDLLARGELMGAGTAVGMLAALQLARGREFDSPGQECVTPFEAG
ncbi:NUDIX hydrolase [Nocardia otitidiscaviarum]|uniref:NUDIX hydrolase n=1 Tax=Nocardia otitidiscaviarum TaxID=1823 RepID=A0A516NKB3_9NOCA|nr:NUDIX hydrolase [Nocardia otitidiscaviarum]MCP9624814.1 NUDIX hydrolase [Nocardia otitidiscaviarum]QDP79340.1 NUDIX hydrolase [Nocardia otitidiscaviarum]